MGSNFKGPFSQLCALDTYIKLMRSSAAVERFMAAHIATSGLSWTQFGVLEALLHLGPLTHKDLADRVLRSPGDLTTVVDNLIAKGLVTRAIDPVDRRRRIITLTDAGTDLILDLFPDHARQVELCFGVLTASEQADLGQLCRKLGQALTHGLAEAPELTATIEVDH